MDSTLFYIFTYKIIRGDVKAGVLDPGKIVLTEKIAVKYWLQGFATKVKVNPLIFISATLIVLVIGWLSISYQTIKAASYNPAKALRIE